MAESQMENTAEGWDPFEELARRAADQGWDIPRTRAETLELLAEIISPTIRKEQK